MGIKLICFFTLSIACLLLSCHQPSHNSIQEEIDDLQSKEAQRLYLEAIYQLDQDVRKHETEQMKRYGYESEEHLEALTQFMDTDKLNLSKIELYLNTYGHPTKLDHGVVACDAPWVVLHHSMNSGDRNGPRRRNFKHIYGAFKNGDIDDGELTFFLNRMYDMQYGNRIEWNKPFRAEEELDTLFKSLDLYEIITNIENQI